MMAFRSLFQSAVEMITAKEFFLNSLVAAYIRKHGTNVQIVEYDLIGSLYHLEATDTEIPEALDVATLDADADQYDLMCPIDPANCFLFFDPEEDCWYYAAIDRHLEETKTRLRNMTRIKT